MDIPIVDDDVLENSELFSVTLERNGLDTRIALDPVDGLVEITDNDGMCTVLIAWSMYQTFSNMVNTGMAWYISHVSGTLLPNSPQTLFVDLSLYLMVHTYRIFAFSSSLSASSCSLVNDIVLWGNRFTCVSL